MIQHLPQAQRHDYNVHDIMWLVKIPMKLRLRAMPTNIPVCKQRCLGPSATLELLA